MPQYNYSIIIPHKEIPELLMRCLRSIPERDDIQIIVVDDNSKDAETYLDRFPELSRPNLELYLTKEGKGAGYARNVGLENAKGKWLLFADADDFFTEELIQILENNVDSSEDVIYFEYECVMSDDITEKSDRVSFMHVEMYLRENGDLSDSIRYSHITPWAKMIKRELVVGNSIRFQEIRWSNDVFFGTCIGVLASSIKASRDKIYVLTERDNSLAVHKTRTRKELLVRTRAGLDSFKFAKGKGYSGTLGWVVDLYRESFYVPFIMALSELDMQYLPIVYKNAIWGTNKISKVQLIIFIILSRVKIWPKISF